MDSMGISKDYVQQRGRQAFWNNGGFLFAEYGMGTGKTKLAIDIIHDLKDRIPHGMRCLHICHTTVSRDTTTPNEYKEWNGYQYIRSGEVRLVQFEALDDIRNQVFDLVIFDEVHKITPRHLLFFKGNTIRHILLLTGTRPDDKEKMEIIKTLCKGSMIVYDPELAIKNRTVNTVLFKIIEFDMSPEEELEYVGIMKRFKYAQSIVADNPWPLTRIINERMWWVYKNHSKLQAMKYMTNEIPDRYGRFLMFASTKEQARILSPYTMSTGLLLESVR